MKRIISLLALIAIFNMPISCDRGCSSGLPEFFIITELSSEIGSILSNRPNRYSVDNSTNFESAAIIITISDVEYVDRVSTIENLPPFISASYACSPIGPKPYQILQTIEIISSNSIFMGGVEFEPGSSLNDLFKVNDSYYEDLTVDVYLDNQLEEEWKRFGANSNFIGFRLSDKPDISISQEFTFTFTFDDGLEYQVLTPIFTVE